jgi:hypothetical protein
MGEPKTNDRLNRPADQANTWYNQLQSKQTPLEEEYIPQSQEMWNNYKGAVDQNRADYGNIMGGYGSFMSDISKQGPTKFGFERVNNVRPAELDESYGYLRETMPGYRDFAQTGGYSPTDVQELRARGVAPIRAAYGNTMMELNRARALGGSGGAPNYIAAASKAQREMPGQMADAMTGVNAELANSIRQGKLAGLSGMAGVGSTMGGMAGQDAGRSLQAAMSNQNADLQAQQLSEQSLQSLRQNQLEGLRGQTSLYGTTPGMASMFGNQALSAYQNRIQLEQMRNNLGLGLLDTQVRAFGQQQPTEPWWKQALNAAGSVIPYLGGGGNKPQSSGPQQSPMGYNTPNNMSGQSFQGYMPTMPNTGPGNYNPQTQNPQTSSNWGVSPNDPNYSEYYGNPYDNPYSNPYDTQNDPYLNPSNYWGYGPGANNSGFTGWEYPMPGYDFGPEYQGQDGGYANPWDYGTQYDW